MGATAARMAYEGTGPWRAPQCSHCRELVASALAEVQVKAGIAGGMPPSYVELICRAKAESGQIQASWAEHGPVRDNYLSSRDMRRSASGLPPVWQVGQYCSEESAKDTSRIV